MKWEYGMTSFEVRHQKRRTEGLIHMADESKLRCEGFWNWNW